MRRRLEDPFTRRRLLFFVTIHLVAFGAEIAAMLIFVHTHDYFFVAEIGSDGTRDWLCLGGNMDG